MIENVLALDLSTKRSGWSCIINQELKYGVIASTSTAVEKRISIMRDEVIKLIKDYQIKKVIIEEVRPDNTNNRTEKVLTWLQGCIAVAIFEYDKNIDVEFIGPSSWRKVIGIQGYRIKREEQKKLDIEYVNKTYSLNLDKVQDDEADAICILTAYNKNNSIMIQPKTNSKHEIGSDASAF